MLSLRSAIFTASAYWIGGGARNKILIALASAAGHGNHGFDYCRFESFAFQAIKRPLRVLFHDVVNR